MKILSVREVRAALARLEKLIAKDGEIVITRRGRAIARLLPARPRRSMPSQAKLRAAMPRLATGSEVHVRAERDSR